jgi:hypothetical protein
MSTYHIVGNIGTEKEGRGLETEKRIQEEQAHFFVRAGIMFCIETSFIYCKMI